MPAGTPFTKITRTEVHGAEVVLAGPDYASALAAARALAADTGATFVPAFDDPAIIAGQGTVALEILDAVPDIDTIVVPVGGGGLVAGVAVAAKGRRGDAIEVVGAQVEGYTGMVHALGQGDAPRGGPTIAEGIAVVEPGLLTREIVARARRRSPRRLGGVRRNSRRARGGDREIGGGRSRRGRARRDPRSARAVP